MSRPRGGVNLHLGNVRSSQRSPNGLFAFQQRGSGKCVACVGLVESEKKRLFPCAIWDKRDAVIAERTEGRIQTLAIRDALPCLSREPESGSNCNKTSEMPSPCLSLDVLVAAKIKVIMRIPYPLLNRQCLSLPVNLSAQLRI